MPFVNLDGLEEREPVPGYKVHFVHSEHMTFAYWQIRQGVALPEHSHPHEQVASMIEGAYELTIDGETKVLRPGDVAIIPPNALHSGMSHTDCRIIDVFYPIREDYT